MSEKAERAFHEFLSLGRPYAEELATEVWEYYGNNPILSDTPFFAHCWYEHEIRLFDPVPQASNYYLSKPGNKPENLIVTYNCRHCKKCERTVAIRVETLESYKGKVMKYGETPRLSPPLPKALLELVGKEDKENLRKGYDLEQTGYGIGAFAYYRLVVENHWKDIVEQLISTCRATGDLAYIEDLQKARDTISFQKGVDDIKVALPGALMIHGGHNPLTMLHKALSEPLHSGDELAAAENAEAIRVILVHLVEKTAELSRRPEHLQAAVSKLVNRGRTTPESVTTTDDAVVPTDQPVPTTGDMVTPPDEPVTTTYEMVTASDDPATTSEQAEKTPTEGSTR